ncbi:MAG: T9SS type A sorting domain-containing protein [Bacteroidales bacterium]|jgi:aminopeptidase N|nr:T9SS type A sorting domain-containing protein [Bacteroidales bacterium]
MRNLILSIFFLFYLINFHNLNAQVPGRSDTLDVLHYDINLSILDFENQKIDGFTELTLRALMPNIQVIKLDLLKLNVDSVFINEAALSDFSHNDTILKINLLDPIGLNDTISLKIYYSGNPVKDPSTWGGFYFSNNVAYNLGVGFESIPHNFGRVWYPCIDEFVDRATYDFRITTSMDHTAVCGGVLQGVNQNDDNTQTFHWKLSQEIPTYLASVAVGEFQKHNIETDQSIPLEIYTQPNNIHKIDPTFANLDTIFKIFVHRFGPYKWDRVGYVTVPFNAGAMEHATNIAYPIATLTSNNTYESLYAHELSHHWFGNLITCSKAEEMWINEGFARYSEAIYKEILYASEDINEDGYRVEIRDLQHSVLRNAHNDDGGYFALADMPQNVTYGTTSYDKGALVIHTLRNYMGDEKFFTALKSLLEEYSFQAVNTQQVCQHMSQNSGIDLSDFFDAWIFQAGFLHFSFDSLQKIDNEDNTYKYTIRQKLHQAPNFGNSNKVEVQFFSQNWEKFTDIIEFSGEFGSKTVQLPFESVFYTVDFDEKMSDAVSDYQDIIKAPGNRAFSNAFCVLNVNEISDSALIVAQHHWVKPSGEISPDGALSRLSCGNYWRIDGIFPENFKAGITLNLSNGELNSDIFDNYPADSIVIAHRKDIHHQWKIIPFSRVATSKIFKIEDFKPGEYCLAIGDKTQVSVENYEKEEALEIFPNPAQDFIYVKNNISSKSEYKIYDVNGKLCQWGSLEENSNKINFKNLKTGTYTIEVRGNNYQNSTKFSVLK